MLLDEKQQNYKLFVEKLYERCQKTQTENERCVLRINTVKKLVRRRGRDVELLKRRLDKHNDNWRSLPMVAPHPKRKIEQKRGPKPKPKLNPGEEPQPQPPKEKKARKQRVKKTAPEAQFQVYQETNADEDGGGGAPIQMMQQAQHFTEQQAQQLLLLQQRQQQQQIQFKQEPFN